MDEDLEAMYSEESGMSSDEETAASLRAGGLTTLVTIAGKSVELPTMAYIIRLERTIERQERMISRLINAQRQTRALQGRHASDLTDLRNSQDHGY